MSHFFKFFLEKPGLNKYLPCQNNLKYFKAVRCLQQFMLQIATEFDLVLCATLFELATSMTYCRLICRLHYTVDEHRANGGTCPPILFLRKSTTCFLSFIMLVPPLCFKYTHIKYILNTYSILVSTVLVSLFLFN